MVFMCHSAQSEGIFGERICEWVLQIVEAYENMYEVHRVL